MDSPVSSCLGLHAALPAPVPLPLWLRVPRLLAEHRSEVEHIGGAVEWGLEESSVKVGMLLEEILEWIVEHGLPVEGVRASKERFEKVEGVPRMRKSRREM